MQINEDTNAISVHGREALNLPYVRRDSDGNGEQLDISAATIYIEIPGARIRLALIPDPADLKGLRIYIPRDQVERIPEKASSYILLDESDPQYPFVELEGMIQRNGYKGDPLAVPFS